MATAAALWISAPTEPAAAFCGCMVSPRLSEHALVSDAAMVVLAREGDRTVLTMRNDYRGPPDDFALVVPVPPGVRREDVRTLEPSVFDELERFTAPQLYHYDERDPCWNPNFQTPSLRHRGMGLALIATMVGGSGAPLRETVSIENHFAVDEYDVVVLSTSESSALEQWLGRHGYHIPEGFAEVVRPYVEQGSRFLVARVRAEELTFEGGRAVLAPLRVTYRAETLALPIRLGVLNSAGRQDVVVHTIVRGTRLDVANHPNVAIPTHFRVDASVRRRFAELYEAIFDATIERHPGAVVTEFVADVGGDGSWETVVRPDLMRAFAEPLMEPAAEQMRRTREVRITPRNIEVEGARSVTGVLPTLQRRATDLRLCYETAGSDGAPLRVRFRIDSAGRAGVTEAEGDTEALRSCVARAIARMWFPDLGSGPGTMVRARWPSARLPEVRGAAREESAAWDAQTDLVMTRMRFRFGPDVRDDLVFREAPPIEGGYYGWARRNEGPWIVREARPSTRNHFEARYFIGHDYDGPISCGDAAVRGVWVPRARTTGAVYPYDDLPELGGEATPDPGSLRLADVLREDVPSLALSAPTPPPPAAEPNPAEATTEEASSGCGCRVVAWPRGEGVGWLLLLAGLAWTRRREPSAPMRPCPRRSGPPIGVPSSAMRTLAVLGLVALVVGCDQPLVHDAGARLDASVGTVCGVDSDCDDDLFCNGEEACNPDSGAADARGCVPGTPPCATDPCDEEGDQCAGECTAESADADRDGHDSLECGGDDCDDADANRFPGNAEVCDALGVDEDCLPATFGARDADADGFIDGACCNPDGSGGLACGDDCDDSRASTAPGQTEICNGRDDDCDGVVDESAMTTFYRDVDGDDFGVASDTVEACAAPVGYSIRGGDCDDGAGAIHPGAAEVCDGADNDCDGVTDSGCECTTTSTQPCGELDGAGGFVSEGECAVGTQRCVDGLWGECVGDVRSRPEVCNGRDDDCDAMSDEAGAADAADWFLDFDGDGFGDAANAVRACARPSGYVSNNTDCADMDSGRNPGLAEVCDGVDNNCNGLLDGPGEDDDRDGFADDACAGAGGSDCDDGDPAVYDGAPEPCDGVDNDCSGDEEDGDGDMHAAIGAACSAGPYPRDDCDDARSDVYPGAPELCDGADNNCTGGTDERALADAFCVEPNASTGCISGSCRILSCTPPYRDCDATVSGGCEADTSTSLAHCGACGSPCYAGATCVSSTCDDIVHAEGGAKHSCVVREGGGVACWGHNGRGQLGTGNPSPRAPLPATVLGIDDATMVAAGLLHTCALRSIGQVACWGDNGFGQANGAGVVDAVEIGSAQNFNCVRRADSTVQCWGDNQSGQMGDGTVSGSSPLVTVPGLSGVAQLAVGDAHVCVRMSDLSVRCWGSNVVGQCGTTTPIRETAPVVVSGLTDVVDLAAGGAHTCALLGDGEVRCWGRNTNGQLGDGTTTGPTSARVAVRNRTDTGNLNGVSRVYAGGSTTCAWLGSTNQYLCWGRNDRSQIGDGTTTERHLPVPIGLSGNRPIAMGEDHSMVWGARWIYVWGRNDDGQLGDGTSSDRSAPTLVTGGLYSPP